MAKVYNINQTTYGGSDFMYLAKETLKSAGWTVSASSDGTTFYPNSDGIVTASAGAGGMDNPLAWYWILDPILSRSFVAQRSNGANPSEYWRIKWVRSGGRMDTFAGSATQVPDSTLDHIVCGSGSDASPSFQLLFTASSSYDYSHFIAFDAPDNNKNIYPFYFRANATATGLIRSAFMCDALAEGGYASADPEPYYILVGYNVSGIHANYASSQNNLGSTNADAGSSFVKFWNGTNFYSGSLNVYIGGAALSPSAGNNPSYGTFGLGASPFSGTEFLAPIIVYRQAVTTPGLTFKGLAKRMQLSTVVRTYGTTLNITTDAQMYVGFAGSNVPLVWPWPENQIIVI